MNMSASALFRFQMRKGGKYCAYCGDVMDLEKFDLYPTIDHVIPKSKGGKNHISNVVLCCRKCNTLKGCISAEEFLNGFVCVSTLEKDGTYTHEAKKVRNPKRFYHGAIIKWNKS